MVKKEYIPERGDIVWLNFNPQSGHEEKGKRPAIVISPKEYNEKAGLGLFCPITTKIKDYPFEVKIENKKLLALYYQIKSRALIGRRGSIPRGLPRGDSLADKRNRIHLKRKF